MARYSGRFECAEEGCREVSWREFDRRSEQAEAYRTQAKHPWKCSRHREPEKNLRPENPETSYVLVASKLPFESRTNPEKKWLDGLFWVPEDGRRSGSGYEYGPGFNAYAEDFPEGTKLIVTARVEVPAEVIGTSI